jgi:hypothetical protein
MEMSLIEQLDKTRFHLVKWLTIGWGIWFGSYILKDIVGSKLVFLDILVGLVGFVGFILFFVYLQKYLRLGSKIKHSRLNRALNNEMHEQYKAKAFLWGFKTMLCTISIFFAISCFYTIPAKVVCEVTLYFGVLSALIAGLIYNKD